MKILIWQSYGGISVYACDDKSFVKIKECLIDIMRSRNYDSEAIFEVGCASTFVALEKVVHAWTDDDDAFEQFYVTHVQYVGEE